MMFIADEEPAPALEHLLGHLLGLTESEHGFIAEVESEESGKPELKYHAIAGEWADTKNAKSPVDALAQFSIAETGEICAMIQGGGPVISNDGSRLLRRKGRAPLQSVMALPLCRGENIVGIVALANRPGGFATDLATVLEPFCSTCATIIDGHRNAQRRKQAEEAVQKLNEDLERRVRERTAELETANTDLQNEIVQRERSKKALARHQAHIESLNERLRRSMTETHHRVKNSLQMIAAMVDMHLMEGRINLPATDMYELGIHVRALAAVHDLLTQESKEGDGQANYLSAHALLDQLLPMLQATAMDREIRYDIADVRLSARQASSLALVVNELVSNGMKYGKGMIRVELKTDGASAQLEVSDEGPGFSDGFDPVSSANTGLDLVQQLVRWDLDAEICYANREEGGARITVTMPLQDAFTL
jgi:two-component sensor histidine kinase